MSRRLGTALKPLADGRLPAEERAGKVLLLAESSPTLASCQALLRGDGFVVEAAADRPNAVAQALASLARGGFDVALCDLQYLAARGGEVRSFVAASDAVVVVMGDEPEGGAADSDDVFDYLAPPVAGEALRLVVRRAAEHKHRCDERRRLDGELRRRSVDLDGRTAELWARGNELDGRELSREKLRQFVVHDLKNQISVVKSNVAYVLEEGISLPQRATLERADAAIDEVLALTLRLLDVGHAIEPIRDDVPVDELLRAVAIEQAVLGREADVTLEVGECASVIVDGDDELLRRVLINLVENAVRHAHARKVVLSVVGGDDGVPVVCVADDGVGVLPADRAALLDGGPSGVGLGLRFCRTAVQAHGGRLWIEANSPTGTAVRFSL